MKKLLTLIFTLLPLIFYAQRTISGKVLDAETKEPLAFVNILFNESNSGVSTDIDGKFRLPASATIQTLTFSYVGYQRLQLNYEQLRQKNFIIELPKSTYKLNEVIITPGENPAHRIIRLAIQNRDRNNPEKATAFSYESYNKVLVTGIRDSSMVYRTKDSVLQVDSFLLNSYEYLKDHHYFLMESISERNHIPPNTSREVVTASRVSGFKQPFFSFLGTQLQSFSLYENYIELFGLTYLSPISSGSISKYLFVLEDTLYKDQDTVFTISFQPRKGKNIEGLKGSLAINTNLYAVENFIAEPADSGKWPVKIQQKYQWVENQQWFPVQLNISVLFEPLYDYAFKTVMSGKSYIQNIRLQSDIDKKDYDYVSVKMATDIEAMGEDFWQNKRTEPLSEKEQNTYAYVDSVGEKYKSDLLIKLTKQFMEGSVSLGYIDFTLDRFLSFNGYEGFRPGLGIESNDRLIKNFRVGGYGAYGLKDKAWKHGAHIRWNPKSTKNFETKLSYSNDVIESSGTQFYRNKYDVLSTGVIQNFFILQMDKAETYKAKISFEAMKHFEFTFFGSHQLRKINSEYRFAPDNTTSTIRRFNLTETGINVRFAFKETYAEFLGQKLPLESQYPLIYLKYTRGWENMIDKGFAFNRVDFSLSKQFLIKNLGRTYVVTRAGYIDEALPLTALYRLIGVNDNNTISVASSYKFQTAFPNEFYSDRYVNLFLKHNFGSLLFRTGTFKPELILIHSMAYGQVKKPSQHLNFDFGTLEHGFYESGILIDKLLSEEVLFKGYYVAVGFGAYYRYGPNQLENPWDNVALKFTTYFGI
jgi:hypothetical protein